MLLFKHVAKVAKIVENTIDCGKNNDMWLNLVSKSLIAICMCSNVLLMLGKRHESIYNNYS